MDKKEILVLIPARYASSRFPGKPLALISGKSMIQRVFENCTAASSLSESFLFTACVVTDNDEIDQHIKSEGGRSCLIKENVSTGSARIFLAFEEVFKNSQKWDFIINVQGDEPLLKGSDLLALAEFHFKHDHFDITTLIGKRNYDDEDFNNPNCVKAVVSVDGNCHYFSRAGIPHSRNNQKNSWFQHIGVYSYKPDALEKFAEAPPSFLEETEGLEQLRALDMGMKIGGLETKTILIGVDTPEDIIRVERIIDEPS